MESEDAQRLSDDPPTNLQTSVSLKSFQELNEEVFKLKENLEEAKNNFDKGKFDLVTVLSVFVAFVTYLGLEVQVFRAIDNPMIIVGISVFFIASILLFVLVINIILKRLDSICWRDFWSPLYIILITLLLTSLFLIYRGYMDYSESYSNAKIIMSYRE